MATYVTSDIHGQYDMFSALLDRIGLTDEDVLYVLGDVIDRGPEPIRIMTELMEMPNVICIKGNHEAMALECLEVLMQEITDESIQSLDDEAFHKILRWQYNGNASTMEQFRQLSHERQREVFAFMQEMPAYKNLTVAGREYLLVHGGLGGFDPAKKMEDYALRDLVWERPDYGTPYFPDIYVVTGHTPTQLIDINPKPGYIFRANNHIAIDCGSYWPGGRLAAIRLEDGADYYSDKE